jgi:hypothetical protein
MRCSSTKYDTVNVARDLVEPRHHFGKQNRYSTAVLTVCKYVLHMMKLPMYPCPPSTERERSVQPFFPPWQVMCWSTARWV